MGKDSRIKKWRRDLTAAGMDARDAGGFTGHRVAKLPPRTVRREALYRATGSRSIMEVTHAFARVFRKDKVALGDAIEWATAQRLAKVDWRASAANKKVAEEAAAALEAAATP